MAETKEFEIHWLEDVKKEVLERNVDTYTLSTGKTPSGSIHLGIFREITICDSLKRLLVDEGKKVQFLLFFDSLDAAKKFPPYIPEDFKVHLGKPFADIPCPDKDCGCESYAQHWGNELSSTFEEFGLTPTIMWTHELYQTPEMKARIKIALDNTERLREIITQNIVPTIDEESGTQYQEQMQNWFPAMAICTKCGTMQYFDHAADRIYANRIIAYYPESNEIEYECPNPACNNVERVSIDDVRLKLNWRVDWPAKWDIFKVTFEPAGKDHATPGGSYDTGLSICREIFGYQGPVKLGYEWLRLGDQDMGTSKGKVFTPREYLNIGALPEAFRYLIVKTKASTHISFRVENLPQTFEDYEKFEKIYYGIEEAPEDEVAVTKYEYPLTQIKGVSPGFPARVPFKYAVVMAQIRELLDDSVVVDKCNESMKRITPRDDVEPLPPEAIKNVLDKALHWVTTYAPPQYRFNVSRTLQPEIKENMNQTELQALSRLQVLLQDNSYDDDQLLQNAIFGIAKDDLQVKPTVVFQAIYKIFLGTTSGPRIGPFLLALDKNFVMERLDEALES
ncbi:MAG TPA: lysine--tRNA ligase [Candidatus Lokiarchaeia archaeon]|nr:lysine--tRNA ligase [Candidatus Lokiarchaeia archaeon]